MLSWTLTGFTAEKLSAAHATENDLDFGFEAFAEGRVRGQEDQAKPEGKEGGCRPEAAVVSKLLRETSSASSPAKTAPAQNLSTLCFFSSFLYSPDAAPGQELGGRSPGPSLSGSQLHRVPTPGGH